MRSSSKLFPVALISADFRGDLTEDVYRLKPGNSPDPTVELALTRLGKADQQQRGMPVILLAGSFSNRRFWYSPKGIGLGADLAREGMDVWLVEMRGHGLSPRNRQYLRNTVNDYVRFDLPAIAEFIYELNPQKAHWLGHSLGGVIIAAALGGQHLDQGKIASVMLFGSQVSSGHWALKIPPVEWCARLVLTVRKFLSGPDLKRGPEDEPASLAIEAMRWHGLFGRFRSPERDWWAGLAEVNIPTMAVTAVADRMDPAWGCEKMLNQFGSQAKQLLVLGKANGFSSDFGHVEMLLSKEAQREVWPLIKQWLNHQHPPVMDATATEELQPCSA
ncbi:alpha/beta fold hydrolase [Ectopseudomonas mendocina]|uniref:Alpha/beta fold hydrolase n=1 Tax=Ectopseudomonas mendocina TaxID=300 RepID=A0ABZ2RT21_ECTME